MNKRTDEDLMKYNNIKGWAQKEIEYSLKLTKAKEDKELHNRVLDLFNYILTTKHPEKNLLASTIMLDRMGKLLPLTPITNQNAEWNEISEGYYRSERYPVLYKKVYGNEVKYTDIDRCNVIDINNEKKEYITNNIALMVVNALDPIKLPYFPLEKKYTAYIEYMNKEKTEVRVKAILTPNQKMIKIEETFYDDGEHIESINKEEKEDGKK